MQKAHLVGIGGSGMRALARVLLGKGWRLSGSDLDIGSNDPLKNAGVCCFSGHAADQVSADVECVIHSSAISPANPELRRAAELGIPVLSYAEMLGQLVEGHRGLAVAGTHGKSTTTAMAAEILVAAGYDSTVVYGAAPRDGRDGGRAGNGNVVLVEACEFRQNFLHLRPYDAVILNIEPDHFDCYDSRQALESAFARFSALLPADGLLIVPWGNTTVQRVAAMASCRIETFGQDERADWVAAGVRGQQGQYGFDLVHHGRKLGRIGLSVFGRHNVFNALAAAALVADCGASAEKITCGLSQFCGLRHRLEPLGTAGEVSFWDDYAHHPTEIATTLQAIREIAPAARICCLFQPHQALRTARLLDELAFSLQNAERVLIADIFRAREAPPQPGEITAADLATRTRALGQDVPGLHTPVDIQQFLQTHLTPGDVLIVMGAGDIGRIGYDLMDWFR
ncbi:MAG: UDP-N-acetylmuramate--L-alanine ligase, partial [Thermoguttaceae bacterium]